MFPHGTDITIQVTRTPALKAFVRGLIQARWPSALQQDTDDESFFYKDALMLADWDLTGWSTATRDGMLHVLYGLLSITIVGDEDPQSETARIGRDIAQAIAHNWIFFLGQ